jgi:hypothetical protein
VTDKRAVAKHRGLDRLHQVVPSSQALHQRLAERGAKLGSATTELLRLLDHYGAIELEQAIKEALAKDSPHPHNVRLILERRERNRGALPSLPVALPAEIYDRGISLDTIETAFLLAIARRTQRDPQQPTLPAIRSLAYFLPLLEEAQQLSSNPGYLDYLRTRVDLNVQIPADLRDR